MNWFKKVMRAGAVALVVLGASVNAKPAQADGGAIIAGIAGGLILGSIIGSTAHANAGYVHTGRYNNGYYAAPSTYSYSYSTPSYYYPPAVNLSYGYVNTGPYYGERYYGRRHAHPRRHYNHRRHYRGARYYGHGKRYRRGGHYRHYR